MTQLQMEDPSEVGKIRWRRARSGGGGQDLAE
jgi:hypothetical protein